MHQNPASFLCSKTGMSYSHAYVPKLDPAAAKAPAASVEQMARSAAFEAAHHGLSAKKVDYEPAGTSNAARNAQRMVKRLGLYWKIPISEMEYKYGTQTLHLPYLSPINVCKYILDKYPEIFAGGFSRDSDIMELLSSWWDAFEDNQPTHAVFQLPKEDRSMTIPLYLYGDEGRGRRRGNTCIVCLETVFGLSTANNARSKKTCMQCEVCNPDPRLEGKYGESNTHQCRETPLVGAATTTLKEHSFLSRIPLFLLPCSLYKEHPDLIEHMLEKISDEMRQLYFEGVQIRNKVWTFAFLGMKGDMKWLAQTGQLSRYYGKKGKKRDLAMCYECLGGRRRFPYEELGPNPQWAKTCYKVRPFPELPAIGKIPCDLDAPERMLKRDWFHCTKLGVWRHYVGSVLVTLIHWNFFACDGESNSVDAQLVRAHGWFKLWTLTFHKTPALRSFSRRLFNWKNNRCFAWCNCKASDVTLLVEWLRDVLPTVRQNLQTLGDKEMLTVMIQVGSSIMRGGDVLYGHFLFMPRLCALQHLEEVTKILNGYAWLAHKSAAIPLCTWAIVPKCHSLRHFSLDVERFLQDNGRLFLNPISHSCEVGEDVIGRMARLSRRTDSRTMQRRCLEFYLIKVRALHLRMKKRLKLS